VSRDRAGFTLIELAVVLLILSVAVTILLPHLPGVTQGRKDRALRRIVESVQVLYEEAAFKKKVWL
jgi:prepilin-type N-terminal cleavage/methylation domain-containing protein